MIEPGDMYKVSLMNRELIEGVQLCLHAIIAPPRIRSGTFQDEHSVVDGRTAEHIQFWRRGILIGVGCEYNIPQAVDIVQLRCPLQNLVTLCMSIVQARHLQILL
jgi:hypothetical protein